MARDLGDQRDRLPDDPCEGTVTRIADDGFAGEPVPILCEGSDEPFPLDVLPEEVAEFVCLVAASTETESALAAMVALGCASVVTSGRVFVGSQSWRESTNLYLLAILGSGEGKSPVFGKVAGILHTLEGELIEQARPAVAGAKAERELLEDRKKKLKHAVSKAADLEEEQRLAGDFRQLCKELEALAKPTVPRLLANDATPEALTSAAANNGGIIAVVSGETPLFGTISGKRYSGAPNIDFLLSAHSGESFTVDRTGRGTEHIRAAYLTLCLAIQPIVVRDTKRVAELEERGLIGRFLPIWPQSNVGYRSREFVPLPAHEQEAWNDYVRRLFHWAREQERFVPLTDAALAAFTRWRKEVERERRPGSWLHDFPAWGGKFDSAVLRLSGLLAVMHHETEVNENALRRGIVLAEFFAAHVRGMYASAEMSDSDRDVAKAKRIITERKVTRASRRELHRMTSMDSEERCSELLERLERDNWLTRDKGSGGDPPRRGRPSIAYRVNPRVFDQRESAAKNGKNVFGSFDRGFAASEVNHGGQ